VGSFRRGSAKIGSSVEDCMIFPSTTCGRYTAEPLRWFLATGLASVTFAAGAAGAGLGIAAIFTTSAFAPRSSCRVSPTARPVVLARRTPVSPVVAAAPSVVGLVPQIAVGPLVSISDAIVLYVLATAAFAACASVSGAASVTFGLGEAGAGDGIVAITAGSALAPESIQIVSPTTRLVVLVSRTPVAPTAEAWFRVVPLAVPRE